MIDNKKGAEKRMVNLLMTLLLLALFFLFFFNFFSGGFKSATGEVKSSFGMWDDYDEDSARNLADECPCTAYYVEEGLRGCPVGITPTQAKADKDNFNKHKCNSTDLAIPSAQQAQGQSGTQSGKPDYSVTAFSVNGKSNDFSIDFNNQVKKSLFTFKYTFVNNNFIINKKLSDRKRN